MKIHGVDDYALYEIQYTKHYVWISPLDVIDKVLLVKEEDNYQKLLFLAGVKKYDVWNFVENKDRSEWKKIGSYNLKQTKQQDT